MSRTNSQLRSWAIPRSETAAKRAGERVCTCSPPFFCVTSPPAGLPIHCMKRHSHTTPKKSLNTMPISECVFFFKQDMPAFGENTLIIIKYLDYLSQILSSNVY